MKRLEESSDTQVCLKLSQLGPGQSRRISRLARRDEARLLPGQFDGLPEVICDGSFVASLSQ